MRDSYTSGGWGRHPSSIKYETEADWIINDYYLGIAKYLSQTKDISVNDIEQVIATMEQMIQDIRNEKLELDV